MQAAPLLACFVVCCSSRDNYTMTVMLLGVMTMMRVNIMLVTILMQMMVREC
jgi:hypothetical protein